MREERSGTEVAHRLTTLPWPLRVNSVFMDAYLCECGWSAELKCVKMRLYVNWTRGRAKTIVPGVKSKRVAFRLPVHSDKHSMTTQRLLTFTLCTVADLTVSTQTGTLICRCHITDPGRGCGKRLGKRDEHLLHSDVRVTNGNLRRHQKDGVPYIACHLSASLCVCCCSKKVICRPHFFPAS